jgi:hypothetical protein
MHLLERAASLSARNEDAEDDDDEFELGSAGEGEGDAQSRPTSFEAGYPPA